ncbi:amino acid transporter AVT1B [Leptopilina heterotoma]|uniref:amino acid transporter AVT1B n=1 Tax=Leptopilina heterotoma TaxID=63436 RepID=UPI001CA9D636|nr:amino acid transporter AVT1B [Leptopilina heterotoma]XP_043482614.1 amino acid transporter AVT1B [Leptopilina heterotoma]XP_043482615.1 amino acid transporter AVT1B [Leptopilina heterotoma]
MNRERIPLLFRDINSGLSVFFATICIIDIFGVFPIIALPRAIVQCGFYGIPLVLVVFGLQIYTASLLGKSWIIATALDPHISRKNRYPLAAVTELTLGPRARSLVTLLLDLTIFGCGIPNILVASQSLQLFGLKVSNSEFDLSFCYWLLVVGFFLCPIMWLGSPRDMKWLASISALSVSLTAAIVWWCIIEDDSSLSVPSVPTSPAWDKFISGYGMLAFQFDVHPTLMTIQVDMRQPQSINKAVMYSFLVSGSLFGITAGLAVWKYGGGTTANVLQSISPSYAIRAAILITAVQLCLSSALGHSALFQHLEDRWRIQRSFGWKRCALRSAIVFLGVAVGESVPRFDIVMSLIGGTLTGPLVFVLPPIMYIRARALKERAEGRPSTPEVFSTYRRESNQEILFEPKAHSQSIYYGFPDGNTNPYRYAYIYYDKDQNSTELTEIDDDDDEDDSSAKEGFAKNDLQLTRQRSSNDRPMLIEASRINQRRRRVISVEAPGGLRSYWNLQTLFDFFGYFVVLLGILITISSTYINVKNTIRFVTFTPPCIFNVTAAFSSLNISQT